MRIPTLVVAVFFASILPSSEVWSQANKGAKPGPLADDNVRYTIIEGGLLSDLPSEAIWRETRQGGKTVSATLDLCYSASPLSNRKERFVVALRPEGGKLSGTGQSEPDRTPVAVSLVRKQNGTTFSLEGTITRGSKVDEVAASDLSDMSEIEFRDQLVREEEIVDAPEDFTETTPSSIGVRVGSDRLPDLVKALRALNVRVDYSSLLQTCADLRAGMRVAVRLHGDDDAVEGVVVPAAAVVWYAGKAWVYEQEDDERFARRPIATDSEAGDGLYSIASATGSTDIWRNGLMSSRIQNARPWVATTRSLSLMTRSVTGTSGRAPRTSPSGLARSAISPGRLTRSGRQRPPPSSEK